MAEIEQVLSQLEGVKKISNGWTAKCPCHDDKHQSLSVAEKDDRIMLYCHAGCSFNDIIKTLNISRNREERQITNIYDYTDSEGKLLYQVVRYYPKNFRQRRPDGDGGWIWDMKGIKTTLYHFPEVLTAIGDKRLIWIVEGEKDVDNLRESGQIATSISGGASSKWPPYLIPLFKDTTVGIIPDHDEPGRKYAHYVASLLYGWASPLKIIELPSKDVSDYLSAESLDNLLNIYKNTVEHIPSGAVTREEFNGLRGLNLSLWKSLMAKKKSNYRDKI